MMISSRGRYALRIMIDLAEHQDSGYITLHDIAARQNISEKYLESIVSILSKAHFVKGVRGKGGGYALSRDPETYTVGSILHLTEISLSPVSCLDCKPNTCERASECKTLPIWQKLDDIIREYLESVTICDLIGENCDKGSVI